MSDFLNFLLKRIIFFLCNVHLTLKKSRILSLQRKLQRSLWIYPHASLPVLRDWYNLQNNKYVQRYTHQLKNKNIRNICAEISFHGVRLSRAQSRRYFTRLNSGRIFHPREKRQKFSCRKIPQWGNWSERSECARVYVMRVRCAHMYIVTRI